MSFQRGLARACSSALRRSAPLYGLLGVLGLGLAGCESEAEPATALVVSVKSDLEDLASIEVRVFDRDADPARATPDEKHVAKDVSASKDETASVVIAHGQEDQVMLAVLGFDKRGKQLAEVRKRASFTDGRTMVVPVFLAQVCLGEFCEGKKFQTCFSEESDDTEAGACGAIPPLSESGIFRAVSPDDIEDWEPPEMDAGMTMVRDDGGGGGADAEAGPGPVIDSGVGVDTGTEDPCKGWQDAGAPGASCGLFNACGCALGDTCQHMSQTNGTATMTCRIEGMVKRGGLCNAASDCARGTTCLSGICRDYCRDNNDCGAGATCDGITFGGKDVAGVNVCIASCNPSASNVCPGGAVCVGGTSSTCVKDCATKNNGVCDEPEGTGMCNDGTDTADCPAVSCSATAPATGSCDLIKQCGCTTPGTGCMVTGQNAGNATLACGNVTTAAAESVCTYNNDCSKGYGCVGGVCRKHCVTTTDCGSGSTCGSFGMDGVTVKGAQVCFKTCDPALATSCSTGTACSNIPGEAQHRCGKPLACTGTLLTNNRCDEAIPGGTGLCTKGSDSADCTPGACVAPLPPTPPGGTCDLVTQCGCGTQACAHSTTAGVTTVACRAAGTVGVGGSCTLHTQCIKGSACLDGLCAPYCRADTDCGTNGKCLGITSAGQTVQGVKICGLSCNPSVATSCPSGYACARLLKPYCVLPVACPTVWQNDGFCDEPDEPDGTRLCTDGTDVADCT